MSNEEQFMSRALELAEMGRGYTSPNPLVGAVLVKNGKIISEGYHQRYGGPHAEIHALQAAGKEAEGSTLYVTLEPCSHHGKTPPCCEAIAAAKVQRVVCALPDPNPLVNGNGFAYLERQGIEVSCGLLAEQAQKQNEVFLHFISTKTPFVIIKTAMSLDGKIATKTGESRWITSKYSRTYVHRLRNTISAIMVGVGTVLKDNPLLTTRTEDGHPRNPVRVVMDSTGKTPLDAKLFQTINQAPLIIVATTAISSKKVESYRSAGAEVIVIAASDRLQQIKHTLEALAERGIDSLLVEGGGTLAESFVRANAVQKMLVFIAPTIIGGKDARTPVEGEGISKLAESSKFEIASVSTIGCDIMIEAYPRRRTSCLPG
ncbi:bifunctional diaminohydroxyphosphoribosylaminopyrimidine deaminase/5-amino-6-(5-phosphoribosylamino)uracil reductase RibD [Pleomorphochaeta sp. DL1XJH-081]|uniref:bifunctional diaminohydroxyphosphoribosylaminopyrimidine deaminase/5-amino-6-(5-phosphoribosylamino)uracil reductase RibD n=1 Tax=Pleomorphochaeta sp. DL1XJH-081 TaxID=3409690 RepID=UPI003BB4B3ED